MRRSLNGLMENDISLMSFVGVEVFTMSDVPEIVLELVERFNANNERYKERDYMEEDLT